MSAQAAESAGNSVTQSTVLTVTLSPAFKMVFVSVLSITVLCLFLACTLVGLTINGGRSLTPQENVLFDVLTFAFKLGFGALLGLLGGKAL